MFAITVPSTSGHGPYTVRKVSDDVWTCSCSDHIHRANGKKYVCRHIAQVAVDLASFVTAAKKSSKAKEIINTAFVS